MELPRNKIIKGDCIQVLKSFDDNTVPLIATSPPYNRNNTTGNFAGKGHSGGIYADWSYDVHNDNLPRDEYVAWQREFLEQACRVLTDDGAIFYNHFWRVQKGLHQDQSEIVNGFPLRQIIIWNQCGGYNFNQTYFLPVFEVIYLICGPKFKLRKCANRHSNIWRIPRSSNNLGHPATYPVELVERCIASTEATVVLDPFMGSGTTGIAAANQGIDYIGIELSPYYCWIANTQIEEAKMYIKADQESLPEAA